MPFELKARIALDGTQFTQGMNFTAQQARQWNSIIQRHNADTATQMKAQWTSAFAAITAAGALMAMKIGDAVEEASKLSDLSERLNIPAEKLGQFQIAFEDKGSGLDAVKTAFEKQAAAIVEAKSGTEEYIQAFERLGVSFADLQNLKAEDIFTKIGESIRNTSIDAQALTDIKKLLGRGGAELIPGFKGALFNSKFGAVSAPSQKEIDALDTMGDDAAEVGRSMNSLFRKIGAFVAPLVGVVTGRAGNRPTGGTITDEERNQLINDQATEESNEKRRKEDEKLAKEKKVAEERLRAQMQIEQDATRDLLFSRQDKPGKIQMLKDEIAGLEAVFNNFDDTNPVDASKARMEALRKQQQIEEMERDAGGSKKLLGDGSGIQSDSLTSIGNFLGGDPGRAQVDKLVSIDGHLRAIRDTLAASGGRATGGSSYPY
ncbi:MAG TPA: hypothetical protein VNO50_10970 [Pyrinomonadaceae bacterium]|nr:hypothetical protein [Pyrinomonadaceae bacterium]